MDTELKALLSEVEAYLARCKMPPTIFSKLAVNDNSIVARMRHGKPITSRNMSRIRAYMAANPPPTTEKE